MNTVIETPFTVAPLIIPDTLCFIISDLSAWKELRTQGIGGSDIPTIMGINPWQSRDQLFERLVHGVELTETEAMRKGREMESVIADRFQQATQLNLLQPNATYHSITHPHFFATPDRIILDSAGAPVGILEIKYSSYFSNTKRLMAEYQLQWYMSILGLDCGFIAVMQKEKYYAIPIMRDNALIEKMEHQAHEFWYALQDERVQCSHRRQPTDPASEVAHASS
jgi:putative phage-type endonuclease